MLGGSTLSLTWLFRALSGLPDPLHLWGALALAGCSWRHGLWSIPVSSAAFMRLVHTPLQRVLFHFFAEGLTLLPFTVAQLLPGGGGCSADVTAGTWPSPGSLSALPKGLGPLSIGLLTLNRGDHVSPPLFIVMNHQLRIISSAEVLTLWTRASLGCVILVPYCLLTFCCGGQAAEMDNT